MEFENLTSFASQCYPAIGIDGAMYHVIVLKVGYRLTPMGTLGHYDAEAIEDEPPELCTRDRYYGEAGASSLVEACDYVPNKRKCDVLVHGHSHSPEGKPARRWTARIRITKGRKMQEIPDPAPPQPLNQVMELTNDQLQDWARAKREVAKQRERAAAWAAGRDVLLDKRVRVTGPRWFKRGLLRLWLRWRLTRPKKTIQVPLRWEHAFGGRSILPNPKHRKNPKKPEYLVNSECYSNPVGCGWIDKRHFRKARKAGQKRPWRLPAPQFYYPFRPIRRLRRAHPSHRNLTAKKMAKIARRYPTPAGFGPIGLDWAPRLALAGTCNAQWQKERSPLYPEDFDFGYYNCAPADQQLDELPADTRLELWHLTDPAHTSGGYLRVDLPSDRAYLAIELEDAGVQALPMTTDTLTIDTDAMVLILTHRISLPVNTRIRRLQAGLQTAAKIAQMTTPGAGQMVPESQETPTQYREAV